MLTANKLIPGGRGLSAVLLRRAAGLALDRDTRQKSRFEAADASGRAVAVFLPRGTRLRGGDVLVVSDGSLLCVAALAQPVLAVRPRDGGAPTDLLRAAYHLGNRHVALEIAADRLQLEPDPVLADMLRRMGLAVSEEVAPFEPEGGAYAAGVHGHGHGQDHGHRQGDAHDHDHGHGPGDHHAPAHAHAAPGHEHGPGCGHPAHAHAGEERGAGAAAAAAPHVHGPGCGHDHDHDRRGGMPQAGDRGRAPHVHGAVPRTAQDEGHDPGAPDEPGHDADGAHEQAHGLADAPPGPSVGHDGAAPRDAGGGGRDHGHRHGGA